MPAPHAVHYEVAWDWDGIVHAPDDAAWEVTNDLGYVVRVHRGCLTTYSMELVECPKTGRIASDLVVALRSLLEPPPAWAGHSSGTPNPAAIRPMQVESLVVPSRREVGTVTLAPQAYCQLHYLIARAGHDSPGLPNDLDMVDASLHVDGTYRAPGAASPMPFTIHTAIANGGLFDRTLSSMAIHVDTGLVTTRVTVWRHLGSLFDAVDFATMPDAVRAGRILTSIIDHVGIEIAAVE